MGGAEIALPALLSVGSKLFGGGGGQQVAAPAGGTPFDIGKPEMNPAFKSDRELFGGPVPPGPGPADMAAPIRNPLFGGEIAEPGAKGKPAQPITAGAVPPMPGAKPPIPQRNELFGGPDALGNEPGAPGPDPWAREKAAGFKIDSSTGTRVGPAAGVPDDPTRNPLFGGAIDEPGAKGKPKATRIDLKDKFGGATLAAEAEVPDDAAVSAATADAVPAEVPPEEDLAEDPPVKVDPPSADKDGNLEEEDDATSTGPGLFGGSTSDFLGNLQDKLGDSATNPLFQVAMGLLASGYDGSNPYTTMNKGLQGVPQVQLAQQAGQTAESAAGRAAAKAEKELREEETQARIAEQLAALAGKMQTQQPQKNIARGGAKVIK